MTSLSDQLKRLQIPAHFVSSDRKHHSLLFDAKEIAGYDRDAIFGIGISGFEELRQLNGRFSEFEDSLFGESSLSVDRELLTKSDNDKLDSLIQKFLLRLTPYFPLRAAQKALEWLIYRFDIHHWNVTHLLQCSLPYHSSHTFVRLLQILQIRDNDALWCWLKPFQKAKTIISESVLFKEVQSNSAFLQHLSETVSTVAHIFNAKELPHMHILFTFFVHCITGAIRAANKGPSENFLLQSLPVLKNALRSDGVEFVLSAYMILAELSISATLSTAVCKTFIKDIIRFAHEHLSRQCVEVLVAMFENQENAVLAGSALKILCKKIDKLHIFDHLNALHEEGIKVDTIYETLFVSLMVSASKGTERSLEILPELAGSVSGESIASGCIRQLLTFWSQQQSSFDSVDGQDSPVCLCFSRIGALFAKRYPNTFEAVETALLKAEQSSDVATRIEQFAVQCANAVFADVNMAGSDSLRLQLCHADHRVRMAAVRAALEKMKTKSLKSETTLPLLLGMLNDKNPNVVDAVINEFDIEWCNLNVELFAALILCGENCTGRSEKIWRSVQRKVVALLNEAAATGMNCLPDQKYRIFWLVWYTVFGTHSAKKLAALLHQLFTPQGLLHQLGLFSKSMEQQLFAADMKVMTVHWTLVESLGVWLTVEATAEKLDIYFQPLLSATGDSPAGVTRHWPLAATISCAVCTWALTLKRHRLKEVECYLKQLMHMCLIDSAYKIDFRAPTMNNESTPESTAQVFANSLACASLGRVQTLSLIDANRTLLALDKDSISMLLTGPVLPNCAKEGDAAIIELLLDLMQFILLGIRHQEGEAVYRHLLCETIKDFLPGAAQLLAAVGFVLCHAEQRYYQLVVPILRLVLVSIQKTSSMQQLLSEESSVMPVLLMCLQHEHQHIRAAAVECILTLSRLHKGRNKEGAALYVPLLDFLTEHTEQLSADGQQLSKLLLKFHTSVEESSFSTAGPSRHTRQHSRKQPTKGAVCTLLMRAVSDAVCVEEAILLLSCLRDVHGKEVLNLVLPHLDKCSTQVNANPGVVSWRNLMRSLVSKFHVNSVDAFADRDSDLRQHCSDCLKAVVRTDCVFVLANVISPHFYAQLPADVQYDLFLFLVELAVNTQTSGDVVGAIRTMLSHSSIRTEHLVAILSCDEKTSEKPSPRKKPRLSTKLLAAPQPVSTKSPAADFRTQTFVLEILKANNVIEKSSAIMPALFTFVQNGLGATAGPEEDGGSNGGIHRQYALQLALGCLADICEQTQPQKRDFDVDALVRCVRETTDRHVRQQALRLLTVAAAVFKEEILHHAMTIFTFVGKDAFLKQDDSVSLTAVQEAIDALLPAILMSKGSAVSIDSRVIEIFRVFVDAKAHIPQHRRVSLFVSMVRATGDAKRFLWALVMLILERHIVRQPVDKATKGTHFDEDVEFVLAVFDAFDGITQIVSITSILGHVWQTVERQDRTAPRGKGNALLIVHSLEGMPQVRQFLSNTLHCVDRLLGAHSLVAKLVDLETDALAVQFDALLRRLCELLDRIHATATLDELGQHCLKRVIMMIPASVCLTIIGEFLDSEALFKRLALDLLDEKLSQVPSPFDASHVAALERTCAAFTGWLSDQTFTESTEHRLLLQRALYTLKCLTRVLKSHSEKPLFNQMMQAVVTLLHRERDGTDNALLISNAILCVSDLVRVLASLCLPHLRALLDDILHVLSQQNKTDVVVLSCVSCLSRVAEQLSSYLSPHLSNILTAVATYVHPLHFKSKTYRMHVEQRLGALETHLSKLPTRLVIGAVDETYKQLVQESPGELKFPFEVLKLHFQATEHASALVGLQADITNLFLHAMDMRIAVAQKAAFNDVVTWEAPIVDALVAFTLKLSEAQLRSLLMRLLDWAGDAEQPDRLLTLFHFLTKLADCLKALFVLFAGIFVRVVVQVLSRSVAGKPTSERLFGRSKLAAAKDHYVLCRALYCLTATLKWDNTKQFLTRERFDLLMQPLVDQLDNVQLDQYAERTNDYIMPCISQMGAALTEDAALKVLNYQLMLKTRSSVAKVRQFSLVVAHGLYSTVADRFSQLLPDTVPFLAELMEDEDEEVEKECRRVIAEVESIVGEPLAHYF